MLKKEKNIPVPNKPTWCPGCGNFGIWTAFRDAALSSGWSNENTVLVAGIGCHGHIVNFTPISGFEGLHGRAIPVASGVKMVNQDLNVFVFVGDGDCLSEGGNHFVHAARRNQNITVILHDNAIYGLTTGQTSPRSPRGFKSKSTPAGVEAEPIHPLRLAISSGATFAAREYSGNIDSLTKLVKKANDHQGFSIIQVLQPCVTFNPGHGHMYYQRNIRQIEQDHYVSDRKSALQKTYEWGPKNIPVGIFLQTDEPYCEEKLEKLDGLTTNTKPKTKSIKSLWESYT